jgi:hypothetical protein
VFDIGSRVWRALGDRIRADDRTRARPVVDDEGPAECLLKPVGAEAPVDVGRAAGREGRDQAHRVARLLPRLGTDRARRQNGGAEQGNGDAAQAATRTRSVPG